MSLTENISTDMNKHNYNWNASAFFEHLTKANRLAQKENFTFCRVSGLEDLLRQMAAHLYGSHRVRPKPSIRLVIVEQLKSKNNDTHSNDI